MDKLLGGLLWFSSFSTVAAGDKLEIEISAGEWLPKSAVFLEAR